MMKSKRGDNMSSDFLSMNGPFARILVGCVGRLLETVFLLAALRMANSRSGMTMVQALSVDAAATPRRSLPPSTTTTPLVIGYSHNPGGDQVHRAIQHGVNVVCWSFLHLTLDDDTGKPCIRTDLDLSAIQQIRHHEDYSHVIHMAAIGGWNAPHPPSRGASSGAEWAAVFHQFNRQHGHLFDGIDWDLEGHDDRESAPTRQFTMETLNIMADMSRTLKSQYGYLVSLAPAESYLDAMVADDDDSFSLQLNLFPSWWWNTSTTKERQWVEQANFAHAGKQCYAYVWHVGGAEQTFDWVSIQLYESFSRFLYDTTVGRAGNENQTKQQQQQQQQVQLDALQRRAAAFARGFDVRLPAPYGRVQIQIPPSTKIVWGFANGWAKNDNNHEDALNKVVQVVENADFFHQLFFRSAQPPRGVMFWTIEEEGRNGLYLVDLIQRGLLKKQQQQQQSRPQDSAMVDGDASCMAEE